MMTEVDIQYMEESTDEKMFRYETTSTWVQDEVLGQSHVM